MASTIRMFPLKADQYKSTRVGHQVAQAVEEGAPYFGKAKAEKVVAVMRSTGFGNGETGEVGDAELELLKFFATSASNDRSKYSRVEVVGNGQGELIANVMAAGERVFKRAYAEELAHRARPWPESGSDRFRIP